jgi:hypothetical protein
MVVSWFRNFFADLSPRRYGLSPTTVHMGFLMDTVALRQVLDRVH